ncbi:MAG: PIN domain-containing protein [Chloroflexi bacterium]|nr:PIN domain-containing protein [Chloroflexota bacterium]
MLLDTSILVAAIVESHSAHDRALSWLQKVKSGVDIGLVSAHSLAELYAILTTLPIQPRISPNIAHKLIQENVLNVCEVVPLSVDDYASIIEHLSKMEIVGGATYDALILFASIKANADQIVSLNERDFRRIFPELADKIVST